MRDLKFLKIFIKEFLKKNFITDNSPSFLKLPFHVKNDEQIFSTELQNLIYWSSYSQGNTVTKIRIQSRSTTCINYICSGSMHPCFKQIFFHVFNIGHTDVPKGSKKKRFVSYFTANYFRKIVAPRPILYCTI